MPDQYKNLLIAGQTLLLFLLGGYHVMDQGSPSAALSTPVAVQSDPDCAPASEALTSIAPPAGTGSPNSALLVNIADAAAEPRQPAHSTAPQMQLNKTQQLWQHYLTEQVDYEWSERYQQELSDYFVTEAPLHPFKASQIQCRQTSCMLQIKSPDGDPAEQQLKLARALNPLREQGKIGVYLIGQPDGDHVQLMIAKPGQSEQNLH